MDFSTSLPTSHFSDPDEVAHQRISQLKAENFTAGILIKSDRNITLNKGLEERKSRQRQKKLIEQRKYNFGRRKSNPWPEPHFDTFLQKFTQFCK